MNNNNLIQLYNLFAELCSYITKTRTKNYLVMYGCVSESERKRIAQGIMRATGLLKYKDGVFCPIKRNMVSTDFIGRVLVYSNNLMAAQDNNGIMGMLQALDGALADVLKEEILSYSEKDYGIELNANRASTGIGLLPRCSCVWARKSRMSYSYRRIDNYLNNFMVMEDRVLDEIVDKHIFLPKGFFREFDQTGMLKVAATPLRNESHFNIDCHEKDELQVFSIEYDESCMDEDNKLVWERIRQAGDGGAELVVFPETIGNPKVEDYVKAKIEGLSAEERDGLPAMIMLPSFMDDGHNSTIILDRNGHRLARQYKQNPYILINEKGDYMEDISGFNMINIFHYEGIGRFAVLICKDFLTTRYMERIMRGLMLTMIVVPSFSTGAYDFKTSFDLCAHDYCNVVWINSCAAMIPGKEMNFENIGYVRKRITRFDEESKALYNMKPCSGLFEGGCDRSCLYFDSFGMVRSEHIVEENGGLE